MNKKIIFIGIVCLFSIFLNVYLAFNDDPYSLLDQTRLLDQEIADGGFKWVGFYVNKHDDACEKCNYELWRLDEGQNQLMLIDDFWTNEYGSFEWGLNESGGVTFSRIIAGGHDAETTDIIYNRDGVRVLKMVRESSKDFVFDVQQGDRPELEVSPIVDGECVGEIEDWGVDYVHPKVNLEGVKLTYKSPLLGVAKDYYLDEVTELECESYDSSLIDPGMEIVKFDEEGIEFEFSNGKRGVVVLGEENEDVVFQ